MTFGLLLIAVFKLAFAMLARRLSSTPVTAPMAFIALVVVDQIDTGLRGTIAALAVNAVWISALLHGLSAAPGSRWYSAKISKMGAAPKPKSSARPPNRWSITHRSSRLTVV